MKTLERADYNSLGDRMKAYENNTRLQLLKKVPVILRLDGQAFHTLTRYFEKPFSNTITLSMDNVAAYLCENIIQGAKCSYTQSDEISILITDFDRINTSAWFDYNIQKMCSIAASRAAMMFSMLLNVKCGFDCRVFNIPKEEIANYFIWRQQDWVRNSVQMYTRGFFSHKQCENKSIEDMHEMLYQEGKNWATDLPLRLKNGGFLYKDSITKKFVVRNNIIFTKEREIFDTLITPIEE